jgi:hypothetical protein
VRKGVWGSGATLPLAHSAAQTCASAAPLLAHPQQQQLFNPGAQRWAAINNGVTNMFKDTQPLAAGTRVRLKTGAHTMFCWRGTATIIAGRPGMAIKDGHSDCSGIIEACDYQWGVSRDQTPNPEHAAAVQGGYLALLANAGAGQ